MLSAVEGSFWHNHVRSLYAEIRERQASKLSPVYTLLAANNFSDVEGSLIAPQNIKDPSADDATCLVKRLNYVLLLNQCQVLSVMEIGFNWGYSASLIMESAPCTLKSIDIARHWYTKEAGKLMEQIYPGRFSSCWKRSDEALRDEIDAGHSYEVIIVDGGHEYRTARSDIILSQKLLKPGGLIVIDDSDAPSVAAAIAATIGTDAAYVELNTSNFGTFDFGKSNLPCFQQRYFISRSELDLSS